MVLRCTTAGDAMHRRPQCLRAMSHLLDCHPESFTLRPLHTETFHTYLQVLFWEAKQAADNEQGLDHAAHWMARVSSTKAETVFDLFQNARLVYALLYFNCNAVLGRDSVHSTFYM